jgi:alkylation response protein AidB-like acyl-CoA dehydrogenase
MNGYQVPIDRIMRAMQVAGVDEVLRLPPFEGLDRDAVRDVLQGFATLAEQVIAPTDREGDRHGAVLDHETGRVTVPASFHTAHAEFAKGGWTSLSAPSHVGGGGFPGVVATATQEMFASANLALSLNPVLTQSAIELLERWGDERQQGLYLRRLLDGVWTGTMNLTEPDAGSDVGAVRATAEPTGDGRWAISGTKIYITWGEHDLTENIVHLVLARVPGGAAGTKGISLFLVPKVLVDDEGHLLERNRVRCLSLEHKMGINASPTCVLEFDGAIGEMVGPVHGGMAAMFSMMNPARLAIGLEGTAVSERAYQQALTYARDRLQGRAPGSAGDGPSPIIDHPDVRRMLVSIAASVDACRLLTFTTAIAADMAKHHPDDEVRARAHRRVDLLTPIAKSFPTDQGVRNASLAVQVHGGMGFVEETGIAQRYRDVRITPIYEGTNGIQAIDLVGRKIARDRGVAMAELCDEIAGTVTLASRVPGLAVAAASLDRALGALREATDWVVAEGGAASVDVLAGATAYQELAGAVVAGHLLITQACGGDVVDVARATVFAVEHLDRVSLLETVRLGAQTVAVGLGLV